MVFLTKLDDTQLLFGSGSMQINTDDIPNGTSNFFLTKGAQSISGSKYFSNKITDNASGSIFRTLSTLNNVHVGGTLTSIGNIVSNGTVKATNVSGSAFRDLSVFGDTFMDGQLRVKGNNLYIDYDGNAGGLGARLYFMGTSGLIKYTHLAGTFTFSHKINFASTQTFSTSTSGSSIGQLLVPTKLQAGALTCNSFRINQTPVTESITPNKTITISCNGVNYKIPIVAA